MRVLTIRQPMAGAIFHGKDVENRPGALSHRGPLLIHAGQQLSDLAAFAQVKDLGVDVPMLGTPGAGVEWSMGAIIGCVDVVSAHRSGECHERCSPWAQEGRAHLRLADPRVLSKAVPAYGKQHLWSPPVDVLQKVERYLR